MKLKHLVYLVVIAMILSVFTGCGTLEEDICNINSSTETTANKKIEDNLNDDLSVPVSDVLTNGDIDPSVIETNDDEKTSSDLFGNHSIPELNERTDWNIELSFIECTAIGINIKICDYDNQGFAFNDLYFVLELYENNEWVKISKMNEDSANQNLGYVLPSKIADFVDLDNMNFFAFLPGVELKTGHYRLTKVLSGREFSVEFDLNFD